MTSPWRGIGNWYEIMRRLYAEKINNANAAGIPHASNRPVRYRVRDRWAQGKLLATAFLMLLALVAQLALPYLAMPVVGAAILVEDEDIYSEVVVVAGDTVIPPEYVRVGYNLLGFAYSPDATVPVYKADILLDDAAMEALFGDGSERNLYAVWEKITYTVDFPPDESDDDSDDDDESDDDSDIDGDDDDDDDEPNGVSIGDIVYPPDNPGGGEIIGYRSSDPDGPIYPAGPFVLDEEAILDIFGDGEARGELFPVYADTLPYIPENPETIPDAGLGDNSKALIMQIGGPPLAGITGSDLDWLRDLDIPFFNIGDMDVPLFSLPGMFAWALVNLILCTIGAVLLVIKLVRWMIFKRWERRTNEYIPEDYGKSEKKRHGPVWLIVSCILGIAGVVFFLIVEDMTNMMVLIDVWTIINAAILLIELIALSRVRVVKHFEDTDDSQSDEREAQTA